jgi:hypothetical protein
MKGDISKLPVWAQQEIQKRDGKIARLERQFDEMTSQHPGTNVKVQNQLMYPDADLPPDTAIDFYLADTRVKYDRTVNVRIDRRQPDRLQIMANGSGKFRVAITPSSSNVFHIMFVED